MQPETTTVYHTLHIIIEPLSWPSLYKIWTKNSPFQCMRCMCSEKFLLVYTALPLLNISSLMVIKCYPPLWFLELQLETLYSTNFPRLSLLALVILLESRPYCMGVGGSVSVSIQLFIKPKSAAVSEWTVCYQKKRKTNHIHCEIKFTHIGCIYF